MTKNKYKYTVHNLYNRWYIASIEYTEDKVLVTSTRVYAEAKRFDTRKEAREAEEKIAFGHLFFRGRVVIDGDPEKTFDKLVINRARH